MHRCFSKKRASERAAEKENQTAKRHAKQTKNPTARRANDGKKWQDSYSQTFLEKAASERAILL